MEFDNRYSQKNKSYYNQNRYEIINFIESPVFRILDVGCSNGNFSERLLSEGLCKEAYGIEPYEFAYKQAKEKLTKVYFSTVENAIKDLPDNYFDLIFFNDVLEHLIDPEDVLKNFKPKLTNNGKIISSIPNVRFIKNIYSMIINKDWRYQDSGVLDKTHLRFFTKKSIIRMFEDCGYKVLKCEGNKEGEFKMSKKVKLFNFLLNGALNDSEFQQFITISKIRE